MCERNAIEMSQVYTNTHTVSHLIAVLSRHTFTLLSLLCRSVVLSLNSNVYSHCSLPICHYL